MADQFQPGDTVMLKSGGPMMTIVSRDESLPGFWWCEWFDDKNAVQSRSFAGVALIKQTPGPAIA